MMNINGLDYNTQRSKIVLPEYGREVQKMVDHAMTIEDREERQQCAETIIGIMQRMFPQQGNKDDKQQKFWDHLAIMSDFKLDIDYPIDISQAHNIHAKPNPLPYGTHDIPVMHYGAMMFELFDKLKEMPEGEERDILVEYTANKMKLCLQEWSHGSCDPEKVAADLAYFTDDKIHIDPNTFHFAKNPIGKPQENKRKRR